MLWWHRQYYVIFQKFYQGNLKNCFATTDIWSLAKLWPYKIEWTGQIGKRSEKKHGCRLASLDEIVGGRGIASGHTRRAASMTFIPARQSFRSSRVSWGWKGSREKKREEKRGELVPEPAVEETENLVRWMLVVASALSDWAVGWIWDWSPVKNRCTLHHRCRCRPLSRTRGRGRDGQGSEGIIRWEFSADHLTVEPSANHRPLVGGQTKPLPSTVLINWKKCMGWVG